MIVLLELEARQSHSLIQGLFLSSVVRVALEYSTCEVLVALSLSPLSGLRRPTFEEQRVGPGDCSSGPPLIRASG